MTEKPNMFIQRAIEERTALFEVAREKLEKQISELENDDTGYDSGLSATENRNEIQYLKGELRYLEQEYLKEIAALKESQK